MHKQNQTIDILRFIAAFAVCIFHFNEPIPFEENWYRTAAKLGWLGVPVFFVISGFCIELTIAKSSPSKFLIRRFFRIYPMYWTSLIIVLGVVIFQKVYTGYNSVTVLPKTFNEIIATLALYIYPLNNISSINWVYWSLVCEVCFYLIVFLSLFKNKKYHIYLIILITLLSVYFKINQAGNIQGEFGNWYNPLKEWPAFALGLAIAKIQMHHQTYNRFLDYFLLIICVVSLFVQKNLSIQAEKHYILITMVTAAIIFLSKYKDINSNLFSKAGKYSYSLYLIHVPIGVYFINTIFKLNRIRLLNNILIDLSIYIFVLGTSVLIYNKVEKPFIKLGKKLIDKLHL